MKTKKLICPALMLLLLGAGANAATITQYFGGSPFDVAQFQPWWGALNSVDIATPTSPCTLYLPWLPGGYPMHTRPNSTWVFYQVPPPAADLLCWTGVGRVRCSTVPGAEIVVTFDYEPVPEPGSLMVLISGLVGLVGFAKRRRN